YLERVASAGVPNSGRLLIFHNLDRAPEEVLEFLHAIVPILQTADVSVLLEVTVSDGVCVLGRKRWNTYVSLFERSANLGRFVLDNLTEEDSVNLLLEELP